MSKHFRIYDLEERTAFFAEKIILLCKDVPNTITNTAIVSQLVRSGTSIGANYCEANGACSKKDFKNKIYFCKKEAIETKYWLRLLAKSDSNLKDRLKTLWKEAQELTLNFSKIAANTK